MSSYGDFSESLLATLAGTIIGGTTPLGLARAAKQVGYDAFLFRHADVEDLRDNLPSIVLIKDWLFKHFLMHGILWIHGFLR